MSNSESFTIIDDEDTEELTRWSEEFAKREFTEEELERIFATERRTPWPETETAESA